MTCGDCNARPAVTPIAPYFCMGCLTGRFYGYWAMSFAQTCAIAAQNGDDDIARKRLYNELKALGMV